LPAPFLKKNGVMKMSVLETKKQRLQRLQELGEENYGQESIQLNPEDFHFLLGRATLLDIVQADNDFLRSKESSTYTRSMNDYTRLLESEVNMLKREKEMLRRENEKLRQPIGEVE